MSEEKRKRSPNWLPSEKDILLKLVEQHFNVIENKKTDGVTIKSKLTQWKIISDQYNSQTTHSFRTADNLKAQWESMKKIARKDAANTRKHMIQTGGGPPMPPKKDDHFHQRILNLITTSAIGLFNPYDGDSAVPAGQDQAASPEVQVENYLEPPKIAYDDSIPLIVIENEGASDTDGQEVVTKDWGNYTPQLLKTPVSQVLKVDNSKETFKQRKAWVSRRRPVHTAKTYSLEQLHKKKMEAIDLQRTLALQEMDRSKALHELEMKHRKEKIRQEKIKTNLLLIRRKKLIAFKKAKPFNSAI